MRFGWFLVTALALTLAVAALPGAARADDIEGEYDPADTEAAHDAADSNDDGVVDRVEFNVLLIDTYYGADADRDGKVSRAELEKVEPGVFDACDANDDGSLTLREYQNARRRDFEAVDSDNDGGITLSEAEAYDEEVR